MLTDGRRTTDDGRKVMAIAHIWVRWAKNSDKQKVAIESVEGNLSKRDKQLSIPSETKMVAM